MINNKKILIVIPCFNVEQWITKTILTIPDFVDKIVAVDDCSNDNTLQILENLKNVHIEIIKHKKNIGVGGAIVSGYKYGIENNYDLIGVMAGDNQMNPNELKGMIEFLIKNNIDYVKGNRFKKLSTFFKMPVKRIAASVVLSVLTKIGTGYYHISDSQSGYTVITKDVLQKINLNKIFKRYGYPNDLLSKLSLINSKVKDYPISAVYEGQSSGLKLCKIIVPFSKIFFNMYLNKIKKILKII